MPALRQEILDSAFALLERAAAAGERCPINERFDHTATGTKRIEGLPSGATIALADAGRISVEIFAHNFRRVTILVGPHAGKATAAPPNPNWKPYKVLPLAPAPIARTA